MTLPFLLRRPMTVAATSAIILFFSIQPASSFAQSPLPDDFNPVADAGVYSLAVQADGRILVGGDFSTLGEQPHNQIGRLNVDGTLDIGFNPGASSDVLSLAVQADGKILAGGWFDELGGAPRYRIGRLNADGTLDTEFNPGADYGAFSANTVDSLAVQADGKVLVGGHFRTLGGEPRNRVGRLNVDGTLDTDFNPGADGLVSSLSVQADGKILVGGRFTTLGGQPRYRIGRLNSDGTLDTDFNPSADSDVSVLVVQADEKILVGGDLRTLNGQPRNRIGRLNADGTLDTDFDAGADDWVTSLAVQSDGKILVGGRFTMLNGQPRNRIGRLNADGTLDTDFNAGADDWVTSLAVQSDGKILVGGHFYKLGEQWRIRIGRLNNTGPATQSLAYDGSTITWLRGGTSPEVSWTTFATSLDGMAWTEWGTGTRIAGGWQLAAPSLRQGTVVRAQGSMVGGLVESRLTVGGIQSNTPPTFLAPIADFSAPELGELTLTNAPTDGDLPAQSLAVTLVPPGVSDAIYEEGVFRWTPTEEQGPGVYDFVLVVTDDGEPPLSATNRFRITVTEVNMAPVLAVVPDQEVSSGDALNLTLTASDPDLPAQPLNFSPVEGPAGLSVSSDGLVKWTPDASQSPSINSVVVRVSDGIASQEGAFTVRVAAPEGGEFAVRIELDPDTGQCELRWLAQPGQRFQAEFKRHLGEAEWTPVGEEIIATGTVATYAVATAEESARLFHIVRLP